MVSSEISSLDQSEYTLSQIKENICKLKNQFLGGKKKFSFFLKFFFKILRKYCIGWLYNSYDCIGKITYQNLWDYRTSWVVVQLVVQNSKIDLKLIKN